MDHVWRIWCEWDIGHEGIVFGSKEAATNWCEFNENLREGMDVEDEAWFSELTSEGILSFERLELIR